jgi:hypothetical protein
MSFAQALLIFAFLVFALASALLLWLRRTNNGDSLSPDQTTKQMSPWVFVVYCSFVTFFISLSAYCVIIGKRSMIWFSIFGLAGISSLYFAQSTKRGYGKVALFIIILMAVLQSSIPIMENRGVTFGPDQWRDLKVTSYVVDRGTFQDAPALGTGFYGFIPLFNVLNAVVTQVAGWPAMTTFAILQGVMQIVFVLSIYAILLRLTNQVTVSFIAALLASSIPRLAMVQVIPSTASLSLGLLVVLLFLKGSADHRRSVLPAVTTVVFAVSVFHPVGVIPILAVCLGVMFLNFVSRSKKLSIREISYTRTMFGLCLFIPLAYWTTNWQVFSGVINPLIRFMRILTSFQQLPSIYTPQYQAAGFELFSFAWALPVSLAGAYFLFAILRPKKEKTLSALGLNRSVLSSATLLGLILIISAFASVIASPGAAVERYINVPGYTLLLLPSSFVLGRLLLSRKIIVVLLIVSVLFAALVIGSSSPDWAPFENPTFGSVSSTYTSSLEADTLTNILPNSTRLYEDHDIPLAEVADIRGLTFITDRSYQTTRSVIQKFKLNSLDSLVDKYEGTVIVIKIDEIVDQGILNTHVNVIYNSARHIAILPP